ncbi:hypothetical protein ACH5RR_040268 [Cinchona calisaya]|uniref:PGG domain-containing protein n=1 Tax=Cinchona calisaya TaxID=153742 RepID=A0ABD2XSN8_9GENT
MAEAAAAAATTNVFIQFNVLEIKVDSSTTSMRNYNNIIPQSHDIASSLQAIFTFIISVLFSFLQLKYKGKEESPFETHPKTMFLAIASFFSYCISYDAKLRISANVHDSYTNYKWFINSTMVFFGSLSLASLSSVLLPESLCLLVFSLSILFSLCQLRLPSRIQTIWKWLKLRAAINIRDKFYDQPQQGRRRRRGLVSVQLPWIPQEVDILG